MVCLVVIAMMVIVGCEAEGDATSPRDVGVETQTPEPSPSPLATMDVDDVAQTPGITIEEGAERSIHICGGDDYLAEETAISLPPESPVPDPLLEGFPVLRRFLAGGLGAYGTFVKTSDGEPVAYQYGVLRGEVPTAGSVRLVGVDLSQCDVRLEVPDSATEIDGVTFHPPFVTTIDGRPALAMRTEGQDERRAEDVLMWSSKGVLWFLIGSVDHRPLADLILLAQVDLEEWDVIAEQWVPVAP